MLDVIGKAKQITGIKSGIKALRGLCANTKVDSLCMLTDTLDGKSLIVTIVSWPHMNILV